MRPSYGVKISCGWINDYSFIWLANSNRPVLFSNFSNPKSEDWRIWNYHWICLLSALMLLWLTSVFTESIIVPHAYSAECVTRSDSCNLTLLEIGDWLEQWSFVFFEILGFLAALALSYRKVRQLKMAE